VRGLEKRGAFEFELFAELAGGERVAEGTRRGMFLGGVEGLFRRRRWEPSRDDVDEWVRRPLDRPSAFRQLSVALSKRGIAASDDELAALPLDVEVGAGGWLDDA